ncbi:MAG: HNH endonuclease [Methylococcaceae bacterium]
MTAFLYTWNPKLWVWSDLQDAIYRINNQKQYDSEWSCGNNKHIKVGDIFFLMRLGVEPKGIVGCGYIISQPYLLPHWNDEKACQGKQALRTDLFFKVVSEKPIFPLSYLQNKYPEYKWTPQSGGISIPEEIATELFCLAQTEFSFLRETKEQIDNYLEGKKGKITVTNYDRSSAARQRCIEYYGYNCVVCDFNFGKIYGRIGEKYIEVHHLKQIADIAQEYEINPIKDLRPVCANCHRMLHKQRPPLSIEELKNSIAKKA